MYSSKPGSSSLMSQHESDWLCYSSHRLFIFKKVNVDIYRANYSNRGWREKNFENMFFEAERRGKLFQMKVLGAAVDSDKFSSKSELSSRFFGRLKFSALFEQGGLSCETRHLIKRPLIIRLKDLCEKGLLIWWPCKHSFDLMAMQFFWLPAVWGFLSCTYMGREAPPCK